MSINLSIAANYAIKLKIFTDRQRNYLKMTNLFFTLWFWAESCPNNITIPY